MAELTLHTQGETTTVRCASPDATFAVDTEVFETGHALEVFGPLEHDQAIARGNEMPMVHASLDVDPSTDRANAVLALAKGALTTCAVLWPERYGPDGTGAPAELVQAARAHLEGGK